ncbi:ribulose-bisphosphate carboxylase large subunit family protein [Ammoniphilus resinae]|uniref:Ribulose-bisphosphate carboxylase large chain n=1 Tax=Ammoniphilus resinae TaxID=861532 RepID=A0ABS4GWA1_9BACL|nr:ribulose-bisphosphate carboxylase large subunit family protein [Ammoniphilus resinae]MBP1934549.1 ribulose-bisphosphate carboxylase large chain [Ammoniphilus resinae]
MSQARVLATYLIETPYSLEYAAQVMAGEQSTGTFISVPGETQEIKEKFGARVVEVQELESSETPSLPGFKLPKRVNEKPVFRRGLVTLSFPFHNFGPSIPNLLATVAGNLYELREFSGLRLMDLDLPFEFTEVYLGPKFGIEGTRKLAGVYGRPIIGTIIKPSIGLSPEELRPVVRELAMAGLDFIKDDELNGNPPYAPLQQRVKVVMEEIERVADITGKKVMYAFNITGDIDELKRNHDLVYDAGGTCVMVSINSVGLPAVAHLRKYSELPIHGHRNQWGAMTRCPLLGMEFRAYQKLCRLVGVDHLHTNGLNNKFFESNESVLNSVNDCLTPMFGGLTVMPVLSSGQWAGMAVESYTKMQTIDVMNIAGGGILAHPGGTAAGVKSMIQGWEAALSGISLEEYAKTNTELRQAIEKFGS